MESPSVEDPPPNPIRFRPGKKRKAYRQRHDDTTGQELAEHAQGAANESVTRPEPTEEADGSGDNETAVAAALRLRNARKGRLRGVGFRSDARQDDDAAGSTSTALVLAEPEASSTEPVIAGIANRFTHQTGLIGELNDKHMYVL